MRATMIATAVLALAAALAGSAPAAGTRAGASPSPSFTGTASTGSFTGSGTTGGSGEDDNGFGSGDSGQESGDGNTLGIATASPSGTPTMTVPAVRRLQTALARLGYFHHVVTGYYGPVTTTAVKKFQRTAGLRSDGIWGSLSQAALARRLAAG